MEVIIAEPRNVVEVAGVSAKIVEALDELYTRGVGPPDSFPYYYKDKVITASFSGQIVGFITYRYEPGDGTLNLMIGWVRPGYRQQKVYRQLWDKLVTVAQTAGAVRIWGSTHVNNTEMRAFYKSVGREETFVCSYYTVPLKAKE